ncbi:MAG: type II secretion system F family protein [Candidatus ainarchaeum sp.]|nr:type II secretion system F family protein [Candidatus ainarchaeum sp.]
MAEDKILLMLVSQRRMFQLGRRFRGLGRLLGAANPRMGSILAKLKLDLEPEGYAMGAFASGLAYGLMFFLLAAAVLWVRYHDTAKMWPESLAIGLLVWLITFMFLMMYPGIMMRKIAAKESNDLLFALREMMVDIDGGVPLFDSMKNVASGDYGYVSRDLGTVVKQIERGIPDRMALRELAVRTESELMKRSLWQMVNALESGASLGTALSAIVQSIESYMYRDIKNYSSNLNFLMLIYMLAATVVPSLGITFLVLLSAFSGLGVSFTTLLLLLGISVLAQAIMIGYMHSTRPETFGG